MTSDTPKQVGQMTVNDVVTQVKLSGGSVLQVTGKTTPEGYPFTILIGVSSPRNEGTQAMFESFAEQLKARTSCRPVAFKEGKIG